MNALCGCYGKRCCQLVVAMTDEGAASRSLATVCDVTDLRYVVVSAHFDVTVSTSTARSAMIGCHNYSKVGNCGKMQ